VRHYEIRDDNMPLQKYGDTNMLRYFVTWLIKDNFSKNSKYSKKDEGIGRMYTLHAAARTVESISSKSIHGMTILLHFSKLITEKYVWSQ